MIIDKLKLLDSDFVWQQIYSFAQKYPNIYAATQVIVAIAGYAYLLLFPVLLLAGIWILVSYAITEQSTASIAQIIYWTVITGVSAMVTIQLTKIRFFAAQGITLEPTMAAKLHLLLDKYSDRVAIPRIDRIVVTEQLSIDIVKTPTTPIPFWSSNTLVIGLPLMQCLSPEYFECATIRKLLQYSKHRHWLIKWLHQLRSVWLLYMNLLSKNVSFGSLLLAVFFRLYAPLYRDLTIPIAHRNELEADLDTLQFVNDEDLLQTIESVIVAKIYLDQQYWPKIQKSLKENRGQDITPYSNLEEILKQGLTTKNTKRWLDSVYDHESHRLKAIPSLRARMQNIGRSRIRIPERIQQTAAQFYLDHDYAVVVNGINRLWLQRNGRTRAKHALAKHVFVAPQQNSTSPPFTTKAFQ
ncbi:MAG: hypothetical protein L0Z73_13265 [Gammaproteobacteria bacterium]|nr:hypothetical protein [Gammaproteobacteria bacterium]